VHEGKEGGAEERPDQGRQKTTTAKPERESDERHIVLGLLYITPQGAGVATGPVKFVVEALRRLDWTWKTGAEDWAVCTYVCICGGDLDGAVGCWS
jgi:hypothetical protein